jgi:hypothetical protein
LRSGPMISDVAPTTTSHVSNVKPNRASISKPSLLANRSDRPFISEPITFGPSRMT